MSRQTTQALFALIAVGLVVSLGGSPRPPEITLKWTHLSTKTGALPIPNAGAQLTASLVLDIDKDSLNDFVITERTEAPAAVWYRRGKQGWRKYVIEAKPLHIEAGGAFADIDGDGDPDIVFGGDWMSNQIWWWENPHPRYDPAVPWTRREIKNSGATQHHDQLFGDFDADGKLELVSWNQGANALYWAPIPPDPQNTQPWRLTEIYSNPSKSEGLAAVDIDGDGNLDIVGGGRWLEYEGKGEFKPHVIDDEMKNTRAAAGQLKKGGRPEVVFVVGDGVSRLKWYEWTGKEWASHDLLGVDVVHGHSLRLVDVDGDGNLDVFCAEMGKWTEKSSAADNPQAKMWIFFGDGKGNFRKEEVATGYGNHESRVADLDGDGDMDILGKPYNWDAPRLDVWLQE